MTTPETIPTQKVEKITLESIITKSPATLKPEWEKMPRADFFKDAASYVIRILSRKNPKFKMSVEELIQIIARRNFLDKVKIPGIHESQRIDQHPELLDERKFLDLWLADVSAPLAKTWSKAKEDALNPTKAGTVNPLHYFNGPEFMEMALTFIDEN